MGRDESVLGRELKTCWGKCFRMGSSDVWENFFFIAWYWLDGELSLIWADIWDAESFALSTPLVSSEAEEEEEEEEEEERRRFLALRLLCAGGPVLSFPCSALLSATGWLADGRGRTVCVCVSSWARGRSVRLSVCRS